MYITCTKLLIHYKYVQCTLLKKVFTLHVQKHLHYMYMFITWTKLLMHYKHVHYIYKNNIYTTCTYTLHVHNYLYTTSMYTQYTTFTKKTIFTLHVQELHVLSHYIYKKLLVHLYKDVHYIKKRVNTLHVKSTYVNNIYKLHVQKQRVH